MRRLAGGLDVVRDMMFDRFGCGVRLQKNLELLQKCTELGFCLDDGETRAGTYGGLHVCSD